MDIIKDGTPGNAGDEQSVTLMGMEITVFISAIDGLPVVCIDTPEINEDTHGPLMRVQINDDSENPVYNNTGDNHHWSKWHERNT